MRTAWHERPRGSLRRADAHPPCRPGLPAGRAVRRAIYAVHALCRALAKRGHVVHVYTTNVDGPTISPCRLGVLWTLKASKSGIFRPLWAGASFAHRTWAARLAANVAGFDILHLHSVFLWPTLAAARVARRTGLPYVLTPHGMLVPNLIRRKSTIAKSLWICCFERTNIGGAAAIHVTSKLEATELAKLGMATRRIVVVPNGIDLPPESRRLIRSTDHASRVGTARLS